MHLGKSIVCVIPARLGSTRLPKKMLAPLKGKPLLQQTYEAALRVPFFDQVVAAVDSQELFDLVTGFGGQALFTDPACLNGTERLVELHQKKALDAEVWVNWQGDEPFISRRVIESLLQTCDHPEEKIWTLKKEVRSLLLATSPHVVKVVCDQRGRALYFSRSPIPCYRDRGGDEKFYKHVGIYAFSSSALEEIAGLSRCPLEEAEKLEQLRFLYHGLPIRVHPTEEEIQGIDTHADLLLAQSL